MRTLTTYLTISVCTIVITSNAFAQIGSASNKSSCISCEALKNIRLPDVTISETEMVEEHTTYCKVLGIIGKEIQFELLLPDAWNNRFVMGGGGGFVGSIQNTARSRVHDGYATSGTNTGHEGSGIKADWAYHNMERQVNFGHLAVHRTAEVSKAIIDQYYCGYPEYSYFIGCSRGGGQALIEAQRYPNDFDGIVAAAPVIDWIATGAEFIQNIQVLYPDPEKLDKPLISQMHLQLLQEAVLSQCDAADGVEDQILNDPRDCEFDFAALPRCSEEANEENCFTATQIDAIKTIYEGVYDQNEIIYPGFPFGAENEPGSWFHWIVGPDPGTMQLGFPSLHFAFSTEMFKYLVFQDSTWDYSTYNFDNLSAYTQYAGSYLNATSTDYSAFKSNGGKMIMYHGWNDPALSAYTAINHYEAAKAKDGEIKDYIRLFMLPGVLHCGGGPGPSQADWLELLQVWVEENKAPERVVVSKTKNKEVIMTRPVFPYPSTVIYNGSGDTHVESSFVEKK